MSEEKGIADQPPKEQLKKVLQHVGQESMKEQVVLSHIFAPKEEVKTQELAEIMSVLGIAVSDEIVETLSKGAARHFERIINDAAEKTATERVEGKNNKEAV